MTEVLTLHRTALPSVVKFAGDGLGARQVRCICSTAAPDRMGDVVVQSGIRLDNFRRSPTVLFNHDANAPIARAITIGLDAGNSLASTVQFPDEGLLPKSDEVYNAIRAGVINSCSIGFIPGDYEYIDAKRPGAGLRFKTSELIEFSFVSAAANPSALITARSIGGDPVRDARVIATRKWLDEQHRLARIAEAARLRREVGL